MTSPKSTSSKTPFAPTSAAARKPASVKPSTKQQSRHAKSHELTPPDGPNAQFENAALARLRAEGAAAPLVCGVDEAGRGPLAGPVVAAAVALPELEDGVTPVFLSELNDSKKLSAPVRERLFKALTTAAQHGPLAISVAAASVREIDQRNILRANDLAMRRAVARLRLNGAAPDWALIDGNHAPPDLCCPAETIVKGDARSLSIAAASIVAKVVRDRIMHLLAQRWPSYGWDGNAGYPTKAHRAAISSHGLTPHHRRSFGAARTHSQFDGS